MKFLTTIIFIIMLVSCKTKSNTTIYTDSSKPREDSFGFYFPINTFSDIPRADSFVQNWYSSALYSFKEAILSQSFVGHNIYRFLWLRSFRRPVVFTLHQSEGQVWLHRKMLDMQPLFHDDKIGGVPKEEREDYIKEGYIMTRRSPIC